MVEIRVYGIPGRKAANVMGRGIMVEASRHVGQWRNDVMSMLLLPRTVGHRSPGQYGLRLCSCFRGPSHTSAPAATRTS